MKFIKQYIRDVRLILPELHEDERGIFRRSFCKSELLSEGIDFEVKQGNISQNFKKHTMRGFHYQIAPSEESKIITCVSGALYNVVLDLRKGSDTHSEWVALNISAVEKESIYVPAGCANAFLTMEDNTVVHYYMGDSYSPNSYRGIRYNDPQFNFIWPTNPAVISERDLNLEDYTDE
tara:strand:+ start:2415 stop:2948 length:534 start_codon:yes stop_codon:yes gene_type:complete